MSLSRNKKSIWIQRYDPGTTKCPVRLVCFPQADGSASYYFPFSTALRPAVEVWAVQYPGRQERRHEPLVDDIPQLADRVFEALDDDAQDVPFAFFGHSMGAVVAFEVARRFQRHGAAGPLCLFASGRRAPSRHRTGTTHLLDDRALAAQLRTVGGTDPRFLADEELLAAILPVTRNDYKAVETYSRTPGPPLDCPITAFFGDADPQTTPDEAAAWAGHTGSGFELRVLPGGHFFPDAHRPEIADAIAGALRPAVGAGLLKEATS